MVRKPPNCSSSALPKICAEECQNVSFPSAESNLNFDASDNERQIGPMREFRISFSSTKVVVVEKFLTDSINLWYNGK